MYIMYYIPVCCWYHVCLCSIEWAGSWVVS